MLYFPLAEERNKWKMFSLTPLGPGPEGLFFESRAQCCLSVAFLLSAIADIFQSPLVFSKFFVAYTVVVYFLFLFLCSTTSAKTTRSKSQSLH